MVNVLVTDEEFGRMFYRNLNTQSFHLMCGIVIPFENVTMPADFTDDGYSAPITEYVVRFKTEQDAVFFTMSSKGSIIL